MCTFDPITDTSQPVLINPSRKPVNQIRRGTHVLQRGRRAIRSSLWPTRRVRARLSRVFIFPITTHRGHYYCYYYCATLERARLTQCNYLFRRVPYLNV